MPKLETGTHYTMPTCDSLRYRLLYDHRSRYLTTRYGMPSTVCRKGCDWFLFYSFGDFPLVLRIPLKRVFTPRAAAIGRSEVSTSNLNPFEMYRSHTILWNVMNIWDYDRLLSLTVNPVPQPSTTCVILVAGCKQTCGVD